MKGVYVKNVYVIHQVIDENKAVKKDKWVKDNQGQLIITAGQVVWTAECEKALSDPDEAKSALRHLKKKWISYLNKLTAITCSKLSKVERNKASVQSPVGSPAICSSVKVTPVFPSSIMQHLSLGWYISANRHSAATCTDC